MTSPLLATLCVLLTAAPSEFTKTEPATWSDEGAFGVRWGMGPDDVKAVYPGLARETKKADNPIQRYRTSTDVFGQTVELVVFFHDSRLYALVLRPRSWDEPKKNPDAWSTWRSDVRHVLEAKYGPAKTHRRGRYSASYFERWRFGRETYIDLTDSPGVEYAHGSMKAAAVDAYKVWPGSETEPKAEPKDDRF